MTNQRPSNALLALLAGSILLAGWIYGRALFGGSSDLDDAFDEPTSVGFVVVDDEEPASEVWTTPAEPRNPFLPVDIAPGDPDDPDGEDEDGSTG